MVATNDDILNKLDEILILLKTISRTPNTKEELSSKMLEIKSELNKG